MPELRFPSAAVWKEFHLQTDLIKPPVIKLLIKPCFKKDVARGIYSKMTAATRGDEDLFKAFERQAAQAAKLVEDWDVTMPGGEALPCTEENKNKFLAPLLWENVEPDSEEKAEGEKGDETIELGEAEKVVPKPRRVTLWLFGAITDFAVKAENFLKN